ncbi:MAG TPA: TonB family protein [Zeimonas sp.]
MSAAFALGPVAPGPIAARDWLVSLAVHGGVLMAALALLASRGEAPVQPATVQVSLLWVEAPMEPAAAVVGAVATRAPDAVAPAPVSEAPTRSARIEALRPAPGAEASRPSLASATTPARQSKPTPTPTQRASAKPLAERPAARRNPRTVVERTPSDTAVTHARDTKRNTASRTIRPHEDPVRSARSAEPHDVADAVRSRPAKTDEAASTRAPVATTSAREAAPPAVDTPAPSAVRQAPDRASWRADLETLLAANKRYPRQARRMGQQGVVTVHARFAADGELLGCEIATSSGFRALDEAALQLVRLAAGQLRANRTPGQLAEVRVPIEYQLKERGT